MNKTIIQNISLVNFRKHKQKEFKTSEGINIIIGRNASGKTSILEAIYLASLTKSYKTNNDAELISYGEVFLSVDVKTVNRSFLITLSDSGKTASINRLPKEKMSDFVGELNIVMFSPEDLFLINAGPAERRRFIDVEIAKYDKLHIVALNNYKKILRQRNELLKGADIRFDRSYLKVLSETLTEQGQKINQNRSKFCKLLNEELKKISEQRPVEEFYQVKVKQNYSEAWEDVLRIKENSDIILHNTGYGPHRDDLVIYINNKEAKSFASIGQQKTCLLTIKRAIIEILTVIKKEKPVFLLDDVFSELDKERQKMIIEETSEMQAFITATNLDGFTSEYLNNANIIDLNKEEKQNGK
ncbi:MAG: DNA replication and repair protein RecF [Erysipelotrichales bacterium]|nr:DNA replication and repair protein RecF [Erysipelotrichales bacterium]